MKTFRKLPLLASCFSLMISIHLHGATTIISDTYTVTGSGTGFGLNAGINTGINPPTTRLTGSTISNLRYIQTFTNKPASVYDINSNRVRIQPNSGIGRFTLSSNGTVPFDFGPSLGTGAATPAHPLSYDVTIGMRNDATTAARFSFAVSTVENNLDYVDFAVQIYRASSGNNFYTIQKRFDRGSWNGTTTTDSTGDINAVMATANASTVTTFLNFLIRVTDAGAESGANYNSRIQVSTNAGSSWIYDSATDGALPNGFRFDGAERFFVFDIAGNTSANVFYDTFSVTWNSGPRAWVGGGANGNWNTAANWGGAVPSSGDKLIFSGTTRQTNTNDLSGLSVPWLSINNGGFSLNGNAMTVTGSITNVTGSSALNTPLAAGGALRVQSQAGTITLGGDVTGGSQNLTVDGAGNTTASGIISGTGSLTKNGAGTLQLSGASANTLSGNTIVNVGTLLLAKSAGNAIAGNLTVGDGTGGAGADIVQLAAANQISDSAAVTISASGSLDLNGFAETVASISGASSASQIALGSGTLTVGNGSAITFPGSISGTGNIVKQGAATMTLSGANTFSGTATVGAGTLNVQNASALGGAGATIVNGGTALEVQGGISIANEPLTLNGSGVSSAGALRNVSGNNSWGGGVTLASAGRINSDSGTLTISGDIGGGQNLSVGGAGNTTASGVISGAGSLTKDGSGILQLAGSSANTYSGGTTVNAGTLSLAKTAGVNAVPGSLTIGDGSGTDIVQLSAANQIADSAAVTIAAGGSLDLNGFAETVASVSSASGSSQIALGAGTLTLVDSGSSTFVGSISGSGNLVKQGSGTVTLSGTSSFSGTATVSAGVVNVQNASALGSTGATLVSSGAALEVQGGIAVSGEPLTLNGTGISSAGALRNITGNNSWSGAVTLGSASRIHSDSGTLTISGGVGGGQSLTVAGAGNTTISGVIASGSVTKESGGTLMLSGANTYSGNTTISAGTLALGSGGSMGNSPNITLANGATLDVSATSFSLGASQTLVRNASSGNASVNGSLTLGSGAAVSLQADGSGTVGTLSVAGNLTLNGNTISINIAGSALGASTNALITYSGTKSGSFNSTPTITGSGLAAGMLAQIVESAGQISLRVYYNSTRTWSGGGANNNWNAGANWDGAVPSNGDTLVFNGTTRQTSTNNLIGLTVPSLAFNNGGFSLFGNAVTLTSSITNLAGNNTLNGELIWGSSVANTWNIGSGSELILNNTTTIETNGDHTIIGGGALRVKGVMSLGQASTVNPPIIINEGKLIVDGGTLASRGGYRIGSSASGSGAQTILTNGASFSLTISAANLRVGDSANVNPARLLMNNSALTMSGGLLGIPFAANATGEVVQEGGTVSGAIVCFNDNGAGTGSYTINNGTLEAIQVREDFSAGSSAIYFNNATLRTASGASSTFMTGVDTAQIQAGGLTIQATSDVTIGQVLSGTGALTKTGSSKITLTGANTYSGNTTISAGTLALGSGGSIASSPNITIANGTTLDVSAIAYTLGASQTLLRNSTSGSGSVNGSMTLASGAKISLQANGSGTVGTLSVTGGLTLNANVITINIAGSALNEGTYPLITYTGSKSGSFNTNATITGSGIAAGKNSRIVETAGQIALEVYSPGIPAHGIAAATLKVVENDLANTTNSVTVTTTFSINGLQVRDGSSRGDYTVQVGSSGTDDVSGGVLITSVAQNGADHGEDSGTNYCTSSISLNSGGYFIPTATAPGGGEYNINVSAAYFPYNKYLGGYARNSGGTNGGANNLLTSSSGINLGTQFVDNGGGISTVNLTSLGINSQTDGVLLVVNGGNNNDYAASKANTNGTWTVYISDNGTNGGATVQGPVAFVFVPKANVSVISGKFKGDGAILMHSGSSPAFSVTNTTNGTWQLSIPGYSPSKGVLVVSAEGGTSANQDNILSFQPSGSNWIIQSRDLPGLGLQAHSDPVASFIFIPAPTATLVSPANNSNVSSAPTLSVTANNNQPGNLTVKFHGHRLPVPGPGEDFMIAVLPDTQNYARENAGSGDAVKEMWFAQTDWIINNRVSENIAYVATLGDCVQNATDHQEWKHATNAYYRLEKQSLTQLLDGVPYGVTVGNHDQSPAGDEAGPTTYYNQYFGTNHFLGKSYYGGNFSTNNDSWYNLFEAGGLKFLVLSFEYGRYGSGIMDWAIDVMNTYPNRRTIVLTHHAGSDYHPSQLSNQGDAIYQALKGKANFFMMLGGHVFNGSGNGEGHRTNTFNGNKVYTLISDYQGRFNGGNGLMRLMYFSPSNNLISIKTYSPWTGNWETDFNSQFTLPYNMQPNGNGVAGTAWSALKTNTSVVPGTQTSFVWNNLTASRPYEWYVTVTDEVGDYSTSVAWKFDTTAGFARPANPDDSLEAWSVLHGITDTDADADGDGQNNYAEFIANTNPNDAGSLLQILEAKSQPDGTFGLTWSTIGGTRYRVQYSDSIDGEFTDIDRPETVERDASVSGAPSTQSFSDAPASTNASRYYRIKVVP